MLAFADTVVFIVPNRVGSIMNTIQVLVRKSMKKQVRPLTTVQMVSFALSPATAADASIVLRVIVLAWH